MWQLGKLNDASYLAILKKLEQQQDLLGLYNEELSTRNMIAEVEKKIASYQMKPLLNLSLEKLVSAGKFNLQGGGSLLDSIMNPYKGSTPKVQDKFGTGKSTTQLNTESAQAEAEKQKQIQHWIKWKIW